jgi:hypothetical protein
MELEEDCLDLEDLVGVEGGLELFTGRDVGEVGGELGGELMF